MTAAVDRHARIVLAAHTPEIAQWVANHYRGTVIGESTVYRLT